MKFQIDRNSCPGEPSDELIEKVSQAMLEDEEIEIPDGILEISLCESKEIVRLNSEYLKEDGVTDVLAFEMLEEDPETGELLIGCIAVNCGLALDKATDYCADIKEDSQKIEQYRVAELLMYILHGMLHFAGFEDDLPEERREMFDIAAKYINKFDIPLIPYG